MVINLIAWSPNNNLMKRELIRWRKKSRMIRKKERRRKKNCSEDKLMSKVIKIYHENG